MLYQAILFVVAKSALAHRSHDNPKIELSGSAPRKILLQLIKNPGHNQFKNIVCFDVPHSFILISIVCRLDFAGQGEWSKIYRFS